MKNIKGITLIALVITIIVLIILAGVAISLSIGENGIFNKAKYASEEYSNEQAREETEIAKLTNEINSSVNSSRYNETNSSQPTGIRTDAYIRNEKTTTTAYSGVTSMTSGGFTKTTDENNNISEYLSYSDTDGYTVLKSGWYYIDMNTTTQSSSGGTALYVYFAMNNVGLSRCVAWASGSGITDHNSNSFPVYLKENDKIYFSATSTGTTATSKTMTVTCYPMF